MINQSLFRHVLVFLASASGVVGLEYCGGLKYCDDGYYCCDTRCCPNELAVGYILAFVGGFILLVAGCVAVCCAACKSNNRPVQIIQPAPQMGGVALVTGQQPMYMQQPGQPMYGQQPGQPMYEQPSYGAQPLSGAQLATQQPLGGGGTNGASKPEIPPPPTYAQ